MDRGSEQSLVFEDWKHSVEEPRNHSPEHEESRRESGRNYLKLPVWSIRYESIIATLCENLDSLDEPDARAAMIWIVGEYAERIDNADELLESFLEGFHDESTQVMLAFPGCWIVL